MMQSNFTFNDLRKFAEYLVFPAVMVDPTSTLIFYNEAFEKFIGFTFAQKGPISLDAWSLLFQPQDESGKLVPISELPLIIAYSEQRPHSQRYFVTNPRQPGERLQVDIMAVPVVNKNDEHLGTMVFVRPV